MSVPDIVVLVLVGIGLVLAVRSIRRGGTGCGGCKGCSQNQCANCSRAQRSKQPPSDSESDSDK